MSLTVINKGEPMKATMDQGPGGQPVLTLEPLARMLDGTIRKAGADGSLMRSLSMTPQPRKR